MEWSDARVVGVGIEAMTSFVDEDGDDGCWAKEGNVVTTTRGRFLLRGKCYEMADITSHAYWESSKVVDQVDLTMRTVRYVALY